MLPFFKKALYDVTHLAREKVAEQKLNINHNDFRRISSQMKLINDDSIKNINRLKLYRVKL